MHWSTAIDLAQNQDDVTYEEWCNLYVDSKSPSLAQIKTATDTAHTILVRNGVIEPSVTFEMVA